MWCAWRGDRVLNATSSRRRVRAFQNRPGPESLTFFAREMVATAPAASSAPPCQQFDSRKEQSRSRHFEEGTPFTTSLHLLSLPKSPAVSTINNADPLKARDLAKFVVYKSTSPPRWRLSLNNQQTLQSERAQSPRPFFAPRTRAHCRTAHQVTRRAASCVEVDRCVPVESNRPFPQVSHETSKDLRLPSGFSSMWNMPTSVPVARKVSVQLFLRS